MTRDLKMRLQDARDRAWTLEEISEAFGVSLQVVKRHTVAEGRGLSRRQRTVLRNALEDHEGLVSRATIRGADFDASGCLRRIQRKGYIERYPLSMLSAEQRAALGNPKKVWSLTVTGLRAARDRLTVLA